MDKAKTVSSDQGRHSVSGALQRAECRNKIITADAIEGLKQLEDMSVQTCVTSPPYYGLRDYGVDGQIGLEDTPEKYIEKLILIFREVRRVLRDDGTLWLNIGDSYAGSGKGWGKKERITRQEQALHEKSGFIVPNGCKAKDLMGIPWMLAFALRADGWYLRQEIIWAKPNPMPESVTDRCTKSHESIFLLSKSPKYFFDAEAIKEDTIYPPGSRTSKTGFDGKYNRHSEIKHISKSFRAIRQKRNKRDVWTVPTAMCTEAHFAVFPEELIKPCVLAGSLLGGLVLDPFGGSGTTGKVAVELGRNFTLIELNPKYCEIAHKRLKPVLAQGRLAI